MNKTFSNSSQLKCVFTDDGVTFCNPSQEVYFPYGCIDSIKISLLGVLQAASHVRICSFAVDRKDRGEAKEAVKFAQEQMKTAPKDEPKIIDLTKNQEENLVSPELPPEEQLKQYKMLFVRGEISKEEYDARKRQLKDK